jgi:hypothetical protein
MARIAFVNERLLRGFGVDLVIDGLARQLSERGHEVTVYASTVGAGGQRPYKVDPIPTQASGVPPIYESRARCWAGYIDAAEHDVVFVESYPFFSLIPRLRTPAVVVDHGVSATDGMSLRQRLAFRYIEWTQQRRYFPKAAAIVTVSGFIRSLLPQKLQGRTRVIYNGVNHYGQARASLRKAMRSRLTISPGELVLLYVGRLNAEAQPYKGTRDLMQSGARLREQAPNVRLVMAGLGSEADAQRISQAGGIPLLDVPADEMPALYSAADIYVTASRWEGFDLPLMEAAYAGVPCVALRAGAHNELVRHGETGLLIDDPRELAHAAQTLAADTERRRRMGEAARSHAAAFTWERAAVDYEDIVNSLVRRTAGIKSRVAAGVVARSQRAGTGTAPVATVAEGARSSDVTAVILNYGAPYEVLTRCVRSLLEQTSPVEVLVVDNASQRNQEALDTLAAEFPPMRIARLDRNYGFAGGMNRGVAMVETDFVLLLNNDVTLEPGAVEEMRRVIDLDEKVIGIAPKIMLERHPCYIDAIGNAIDPQGSAFNIGIGQLDVGQYDRVERAFGACFAATLLRRKAFDPGLVGPLEERFFMYYEDVDWCFRANALGFQFLTAPMAVVHHTHSMSTRELDYAFKYRLIMRNFMWTAARDFERRRAWRAVARRTLGQIRNVIRGPYRRASLMILIQGAWGLPSFWRARTQVQRRRRVNDDDIFGFSHGERAFFDPVSYSPMRRLEALAFAYHRLFLIKGEERYRRIAEAASGLAGSRVRFDRDLVIERLRPLIADEPPRVLEFVESLEV